MNALLAKPKIRQGLFDFESLLGTFRSRSFLNVPEAARILRRSDNFIYALIEEGQLDAHTAGGGKQPREKDRRTVTTRSVALYIARTALYPDTEAYAARLRDLALTWTTEQRREFAAWLLTTL